MAQASTEFSSNVHTGNDRKKRKRPPTFQYHPEKRAKKLKKEWIEKEKIKAKWRAQKRKEGLGNTGLSLLDTQREGEADLNEVNNSDIDQHSEENLQPGKLTARQQESINIRNTKELSKASLTSKGKHPDRINMNDDTKSSTQTEEVSLRELRKKAYSHSSLHSYKSDPFRRRKDKDSSFRGGGSVRSKSGQPNMKLRMEAMLEKIRRDIT